MKSLQCIQSVTSKRPGAMSGLFLGDRKVGAGGTALLQLATLAAKRQRSEATPLRHAVRERTR